MRYPKSAKSLKKDTLKAGLYLFSQIKSKRYVVLFFYLFDSKTIKKDTQTPQSLHQTCQITLTGQNST